MNPGIPGRPNRLVLTFDGVRPHTAFLYREDPRTDMHALYDLTRLTFVWMEPLYTVLYPTLGAVLLKDLVLNGQGLQTTLHPEWSSTYQTSLSRLARPTLTTVVTLTYEDL